MAPYYLNKNNDGLLLANPLNDGYTIALKWAQAFPNVRSFKIGYNIYMSSDIAPDFPINFFTMFPSFVSFDGSTAVDIINLIPGQMYHFAVRAFEYDPNIFNPSSLPSVFNGLAILPQSLLSANISATDTFIPLVSIDGFPSSGTVRIGAELVFYSSVNTINGGLNVPSNSSGTSAIIDQGGGHFYTANASNVGSGIINNLQLVLNTAPTETWTIKCVEVLRDSVNNPIPKTSRFIAIGSASGSKIGSKDFIWIDDGVILSNNILSFSITETTPFKEGDYFIIKVQGTLPSIANGRGFNNSIASIHNTDGYDGNVFQNPNVVYWPIITEEQNTRVFECWCRFDIDHELFTLADGYRQKTKDILTTDLTFSDATNTGFPAFDFSGYHRTDPVLLLNGTCIGSYIGGTFYCADGYNGVGMQLRGISIQDQNTQRQEVLLSTTGEPVCLIKRQWTGITCKCMLPYNEYPEARCQYCYGTGIVLGYTQFFDQRRSDGRIMVRFDPSVDDLIATDSGLESTLQPNCWTLNVPSLKDRDFIVRFDEDGNEEYRYEILNVTRNKTVLNNTGAQKFVAQRIRKTDIIYQVKVFRDTSKFPVVNTTSISSSLGIPPHAHQYTFNELSPPNATQLTQIAAGHNHILSIDPNTGKLVVSVELGHTHTL